MKLRQLLLLVTCVLMSGQLVSRQETRRDVIRVKDDRRPVKRTTKRIYYNYPEVAVGYPYYPYAPYYSPWYPYYGGPGYYGPGIGFSVEVGF